LLVRGSEPGTLACPVFKSGVIVHRPMSAAAVRLMQGGTPSANDFKIKGKM
jgi:hypothetical protein